MAYIVVSQIGSTDITCYVAGLDTSYPFDDRRIEWFYNGEYRGTSRLGPYVSSGGSLIVDDLTPNTTYEILADILYRGGVTTLTTTATTKKAAKPPEWEWYTPKNNMLFPVTVDEWLDFCERINQTRTARNLSAYSFTTNIWPYNGFSADIFLEAVYALTPFWGLAPELSQIKSMNEDKWGASSIVKSWYFENLKSCLNQAISEIK